MSEKQSGPDFLYYVAGQTTANARRRNRLREIADELADLQALADSLIAVADHAKPIELIAEIDAVVARAKQLRGKP